MDHYYPAVSGLRPALLAMLACAGLSALPALAQTRPRPASAAGTLAAATSAPRTSNAGGLPAALQAARPSDGVCHKEDVAELGKLPQAPDVRADLTCAMVPAALRKQLTATGVAPDWALIDLRQNDDFQAYHINGAMNLGLADLHGKPYWRNKQVVLIGNGKGERELYAACTQLKQSGYKQVSVLRGGMPAWLAQQGPVLGRVPQRMPQMLRLSPAEFLLEAQNPDNLVLLGKAQIDIQRELPLAMPLTDDTVDALQAVLARRRKELKDTPLATVVVVAAGLGEEQIGRMQQALAPLPLLLYMDSPQALAKQVALQKQIWLAQARGPRPLGCGL